MKRLLASKAPCLAHTSCPILSTQIFSIVSRGSLQADTCQEKMTECTLEEGYWKPSPCLSLPASTKVLPASTCRIRNCHGPHLWISHFCVYSLKLVLLWTCPISLQKSTSWRWSSYSHVTKYFGAALWISSNLPFSVLTLLRLWLYSHISPGEGEGSWKVSRRVPFWPSLFLPGPVVSLFVYEHTKIKIF